MSYEEKNFILQLPQARKKTIFQPGLRLPATDSQSDVNGERRLGVSTFIFPLRQECIPLS
jgi:hypothetical protein